MKIPIQYDGRYVVTQEMVAAMRAMRRLQPQPTYQQIADHFGVSEFTARYWINDSHRQAHRRLTRRHIVRDKEKTREYNRRVRAKQRWLRRLLPETRLRDDYSAIVHSKRKRYGSKGRSVQEVIAEYHRTKAKWGDNRKIAIPTEPPVGYIARSPEQGSEVDRPASVPTR